MSQQIAIPATYMRGGTSKGVFFALNDLPEKAREPGIYRDKLMLRVIGSPDPYAKHTDGMGGATSSTSKVVILSKSDREDCDVNYLFGQIAIDKAKVDWSGNCGNLTAAVGVFAIQNQLIDPSRLKETGKVKIRIWQQNIQKIIVCEIHMEDGVVRELGDFELDGVTFPASEIVIHFIAPASGNALSTGEATSTLSVNGLGDIPASLINAGIPTVFVNASDIGLEGTESQKDINTDPDRLAQLESIRSAGAKAMGIELSGHIPKVAFVSPAKSYVASSGKSVEANQVDLLVRAVSMGQLHHAMMGTAAVAIASAAAIPGTLVQQAACNESSSRLVFGHPSGTLTVGAQAQETDSGWEIDQVSMSRSARTLMQGQIFVPEPTID